jgi:spermidine/putrescine transport system substrate-binding protein
MNPKKPVMYALTGILLTLTLLLSACGGAVQATETPPEATEAPITEAPATEEATSAPTQPPAAETTGTLSVLEWAGYDAEDFWVDFKDAYPDVTVNFEIGISDADIYAKMAAGNQADVFHPYSGWLQFYVDEGLVEEIDTSKITNWDKVSESHKKLGQINGKQYFIPWDIGFTSILYRTDKIPEGVDSWAALMDPKYAGHISMWDDGPGAVTISSYIHGYDETAITDEQLAAIKEEWIAQRDLNLFYWAGEPELQEGMRSGDVWAAYAWQGSYALLLGEGVPVAYANPKEGRNSWVGFYGIRKGTENLDLAMKFLDAKLAEATGNHVVNDFYYGHSNQDVMKNVTDPMLMEAFGLNDPSILEKTNFTPNLTAEQRDAWTAMWAEVKAAP